MNTNAAFAFAFLGVVNLSYPSMAATFKIEINTQLGSMTRQLTSFDQREQTIEEAYNYTKARYQGNVPIDSGTNLFLVHTKDGLAFFSVNKAYPDLEGKLKYSVTTQGKLALRDDKPGIDNDPIEIIDIGIGENGYPTTTFISTEGFSDINCTDDVCQTDGMVILFPNGDQNHTITFQYDTTSPMINIDKINFYSSISNESFSLEIGKDFDPNSPVVFKTTVPESSSLIGLAVASLAAFALPTLQNFSKF